MSLSSGCGNGVPMWLQQKAAPELIGKQLETHFPYNLVLPIEQVDNLGFGISKSYLK